jgi:hypothetical protein
MTTTWDSLLAAALLGTERRKPEIPPDAPAPLNQLPTDDAEHRLLTAAGMMSVYRRAGYTPAEDSRTLDAPAPEETLPPCSFRAASRLLHLLAYPDANRLLIGEWLYIVARLHKRIPHIFLADVMQTVKRDKALMPMLVPVMGERGVWLAARNSQWAKYLKLKPDADSQWIEALFSRSVPAEEIAQAEATAFDSLKNVPLHDPSLFVSLMNCRHLWSDKLVEAFVRRVIDTHKKKVRLRLPSDVVGLFVASVPRGSIGSVIVRLKSAIGDEPRHSLFFQPMLEMLDLRRTMLGELSNE